MKSPCLFALVGVAAADLTSTPEDYQNFKLTFGKVYNDDEDSERYEIFQASVKQINELNAKPGDAKFGLNWMADEKASGRKHRGYRRNAQRDRNLTEVVNVENPKFPHSIDWRLTEAVTPIKNQGQCGSCWAFSATETIESHFILGEGMKYGLTLSPQQITSCTTADYGCGGGEPMDAYDYVMSVPGLTNSWNWPYVESMTNSTPTAPCDAAKEAAINGTLEALEGRYVQLTGYKFATPPCYDAGCYHQNLTKLAEAVELGPVSICVVAQEWDFYEGGIMSAEQCGPMGDAFVDHCVQLVGFNKKDNYWIVRNSWGTEWGEEGNIYLQMDMNTCGLADEATIPHIAHAKPELHRPSMLHKAMHGSTVTV